MFPVDRQTLDFQPLEVQFTPWQGKLLVYYPSGARTYPIIREMIAPLKLQRPFYTPGSSTCQSVLLHTAGGIVGGDRLSLSLTLAPHTRVFWTTPAATKVYASPEHFAQTQVHLQIEPGAVLTWFPLETILFDGAKYRQQIHIDLQPGGVWCGWEITRCGRTAQGEGFHRGQWISQTLVFSEGMPLWVDAQGSFAPWGALGSDYGFGGYPVVGTLCWLGKGVSQEIIQEVRSLFSTASPQRLRFGVTTLPQGLLCRYRGSSTQEAKRWFIEVWRILARFHQQEILVLPRIWAI